MTNTELAKRLSAVERDVAVLKSKKSSLPGNGHAWVEKIAGTFSSPEEIAAFDKAMSLGRKWRKAQNVPPLAATGTRRRKAAKK